MSLENNLNRIGRIGWKYVKLEFLFLKNFEEKDIN